MQCCLQVYFGNLSIPFDFIRIQFTAAYFMTKPSNESRNKIHSQYQQISSKFKFSISPQNPYSGDKDPNQPIHHKPFAKQLYINPNPVLIKRRLFISKRAKQEPINHWLIYLSIEICMSNGFPQDYTLILCRDRNLAVLVRPRLVKLVALKQKMKRRV